ncbi:MAG: TetR/AcrR family transcriptional regulator, partial [Candidatus Limnocylindrales bacterium]
MPKLWAETMDSHRRQVNDAILDATAELVAEQGPLGVSMSGIAERTGIGRATLYKYFPDVQSILVSWHARDFTGHLERLRALSTAKGLTLQDVAHFVFAQRRHHAHGKGGDVLGPLAHTLAGAQRVPEGPVQAEIIGILTAL